MSSKSLEKVTGRRIVYMAPDLSDPAVERRRLMLEAGGATVALSGFVRGQAALSASLAHAEILGRTQDAALAQRALAVARQLLAPFALRRRLSGQDAVIARNLEMLVLARAGAALARRRPKICYEVLDIHGVMLGDGVKSRLLRAIERLLLRRVDLLMLSSDAFDRAYFTPRQGTSVPRLLVENKVLALTGEPGVVAPSPSSPPWRIGWFGMLRCWRSLNILGRLAAARPGLIEVDIRGRPSPAVFGDDFEAEIARRPGLTFHGPYRPSDLAPAYGDVHFVWAVDFYEEGQNSSWLLPNRLYEGSSHGRPLIAQRDVETGRWLQAHGAGVLFDDLDASLAAFFDDLSPAAYEAHADAVRRIPLADLLADQESCGRLVEAVTEGVR